MKVNTKIGVLEARVVEEPNYPGIQIGLNINGEWIEYAWVEVDQCGNEPMLKVHIFDTVSDEPLYTLEQPKQFVEHCLVNGSGGRLTVI